MSEDNINPATNVPAIACAAVKDFLAKAAKKLPPGMEAADSIYQTLNDVLEALGCAAVDGVDRTITISVKHIDDVEARISVTTVLHLSPESDIEGCH